MPGHKEHPEAQATAVRQTPGILRRVLRFLAKSFCALLVLFVLGGVALFAWLRTEQASELLREKLNAALEEPLQQEGLSLTLTSLRGALPLQFIAGLELRDKEGLWLEAPETRFSLSPGLFPPRIVLEECQSISPRLIRLPLLPEKEKPLPDTPPPTPKDILAIISEAVRTIFGLPDWLPEVVVQKTGVTDLSLPENLLGFQAKLTATLESGFDRNNPAKAPRLRLALPLVSLTAKDLHFSGEFSWLSGINQDSWLSGDLALHCKADLLPKAFLQKEGLSFGKEGEKDRFSLSLNAEGPLVAPHLLLTAAFPDLTFEGTTVENTSLTVASKSLDVMGFLGSSEHPLGLDLSLQSQIAKQPLSLALSSSLALASDESFSALRAGLQSLVLKGPGFSVKGEGFAQTGEDIPSLSGTLLAEVSDWQAVAPFLPITPKGPLALDIRLTPQTSTPGGKNDADVSLALSLPNFSLLQGQEELVRLEKAEAGLSLDGLFSKRHLDAQLSLGRLAKGPLALALKAKAKGDLGGQIAFATKSSGALTADIEGAWKDGLLELEKLFLSVRSDLLGESVPAGTTLGVRASSKLSLAYGDEGLTLAPLSLTFMPAGQVRAEAKLTRAAKHLSIQLDECSLESFRSLLPSLPTGKVKASCSLKGSATALDGSLSAQLKGLVIPGVRIDPLDLTLTSKINEKSLQATLLLPEKTVRVLGGEKTEVTAKIPLLLKDGVPALDENGSLAGKVFWKGRLAPLWKLVPASQRLSGDLLLDFALSGKPTAPALSGSCSLARVLVEDPVLGLLLRDIGLTAKLEGKSGKKGGIDGRVTLDGKVSDGMGGSLTVNGFSTLTAEELQITTHLDHLRPLRRNDVRLSLSGDVLVRGSATNPEVRGKILVDNGAVRLENIEAGPGSVTTLPITEKKKAQGKRGAPEASAEKNAPFGHIDLAILSPGRFLIDGFGLLSEWKTDLLLRGPLNQPVITGEVSAVKGELDFLNKRFSLEKGIVSLAGGNVANPLLDMLLTNTSGDKAYHIRITGPVKKLKLSLTSDPAMPQDDVLAHILFGKNANELGRYEALQLAAAMAKTASGLGSGLDNPRKALGMDVMRLKSGEGKAEQGVDSMAVETGKYLTDSLYVGVEQGAKQGSTAAIIQLEITPKLKLELRSQQNTTKGSLNWKHSY